jgi:hypothetical protein
MFKNLILSLAALFAFAVPANAATYVIGDSIAVGIANSSGIEIPTAILSPMTYVAAFATVLRSVLQTQVELIVPDIMFGARAAWILELS